MVKDKAGKGYVREKRIPNRSSYALMSHELIHILQKQVTKPLVSSSTRSSNPTQSVSIQKRFSASASSVATMEPTGTIVFSTVGRLHYGFDIFSVKLPINFDESEVSSTSERRLTDGVSINFNGQFVDEDNTVVYISERTGSAGIFLSKPGGGGAEQVLPATGSLFHDRPIIKDDRLYFISAHERPDGPFKSWSSLYSARPGEKEVVRLTPRECADFSPAISQSGNLIAVASYGNRTWGGEFHDLQTDVVVFQESDPSNRLVVCQHGGWPTWSGDSTLYFHRQADDGWWSIFRVDFAPSSGSAPHAPVRVTPPGVHCFTPSAMHGTKRIAVATRRKGNKYRHIEVFDVDSRRFHPVTSLSNPNLHHYNPFVSPESGFLGYHRFRGEGAPGDSVVPNLEPVSSPIPGLRMLRLNGSFPVFSPSGDHIAMNRDFLPTEGGVWIIESRGSSTRTWTLLEKRSAFYNAWSPAEENVVFTSVGPVFHPVKANVQIARIAFDPSYLSDPEADKGGERKVPVDIKILTREESGNNAFPSCSPDGKWIVFRSGRSGHKNLYVTDALNGEFEGGTIRRLTEGPWIDTMPCWSPDGELIAFSSNRHNPANVDGFGIYLIRPDGTGLRRVDVVREGGSEMERSNHVCFSGHGEWLLFTSNLDGVTAEPVSLPNHFQPYGELYVVRLDGSGLQRLTWNGYENGTPAWHPNPSLFFGTDHHLHGGEEEDLMSFSRLCVEALDEDGGGEVERLKGQFDEPLWIKCDGV